MITKISAELKIAISSVKNKKYSVFSKAIIRICKALPLKNLQPSLMCFASSVLKVGPGSSCSSFLLGQNDQSFTCQITFLLSGLRKIT